MTRPVSSTTSGRRLRRAVAASGLAAVLLLAAGCGSDGDGGDAGSGDKPTGADRTAAKSLSAVFQDGGLSAAEADCVAEAWVDGAGTDTLVDAGILDEQHQATSKNSTKPTRKVVEPYVEGYFDCVDYGKQEAAKFDRSRPGIIDKASFAECADRIDKDDAQQAMADSLLQKNTEVRRSVDHQLVQCTQAPPLKQ